jgi:hypothetical protein
MQMARLMVWSRERMTNRRKQVKTSSEDLWFVRKYCFANSYPASDVRCPYTKAKIVVKPANTLSDNRKVEEVDGIFLCRYPNENMPLHEARLISELDQCPSRERRKMIDALYKEGI